MNIGILGYGRMGKSVEAQALKRGHHVFVLPIERPNSAKDFDKIDCVIDFSNASVAPSIISECLLAGKNVVSGTTGWNEQIDDIKKVSIESEAAFCWSPNFSVGMQITFFVNKMLAKVMNQHDSYTPRMLEIHHTAKLDAPSGTAIAMADQVIENIERMNGWELLEEGESQKVGDLSIEARREENVKGIHRLTYVSDQDTISLRHHALSRDGFSLGAVIAAEWLQGKSGNFSFEEILNFN